MRKTPPVDWLLAFPSVERWLRLRFLYQKGLVDKIMGRQEVYYFIIL